MTFDTTEATASTIGIVTGATGATSRPGRVPIVMPAEQAYYWRYRWQKEQRECLLELDSGDARTFDSDDPEDAARWLLEPDDE